MNKAETFFFEAFRAGLRGEKLTEAPELTDAEWERVFYLADIHEVLPLIYDTLCGLPALREIGKKYKDAALNRAIRQIVQTNEFLTLVLQMQAVGLNPIVMKGIICRSLYPQPCLRPSVDEDILVPPEQMEAYDAFLLSKGLFADEPGADLKTKYEYSYHKENSPTYIELHKNPIPPESGAYGDCNVFFEGVFDRAVTVQVEDVVLRTMGFTDHMLFLICHAYKHLLHSGVGIRQIADMAVFTEHYGSHVDWKYVLDKCRSVKIDKFAVALFVIAEKYLGFDRPELFKEFSIDEKPLLEDIMSGGLYGVVDENRAHSATMTLDAVASVKSGKKHSKGIIPAVFPAPSSLEGRYPYLRGRHYLAPVAWAQRLFRYAAKKRKSSSLKASESVKIAKDRVALLRKYDMLP